MTKKLYIDVTELVGWQGKLTGVPRVMYEIGKRFSKDSHKAPIFVAWQSNRSQFVVIGNKEIFDKDSYTESAQAINLPRASTRNIVKSAIVKIPVFKKAAITVKANIPSRHKISGQSSIKEKPEDIKFISGDSILVLSDWHGSDSNYVDRLTKLNAMGVSIYHIVYDLLPIVTPQFSGHTTDSLTIYSKKIYPLCKKIFAISVNTKKDITNWLELNNLHVPSIKVIRLGDDYQSSEAKRPKSKLFITNKPFILCVGTIEARKNHALLYYVYKLAKQTNTKLPPLVIVGRRGWMTEDVYSLITNDPQTKDNFLIIENASDEELSWLYSKCLFTVYPSFYEGWGLPIAESVSRGIPCACSNTSSMPEVAGDLAYYFSPNSTDECLTIIKKLLEPGEIGRSKKRLLEYKMVTWDETFKLVKEEVVYANEPS